MATRTKVTPAGQSRVSAKVAHLVRGGEVPNTPTGRRKALGMAYGMEEAGRLGARGGYRPVGSPKPVASRPYTAPSAAVPRMAKGGVVKHSKAHPGFRAVQAEIASNITPRRKGQTKEEAAGAILASRTRSASAAAKKANPRLKRVRGA